MSKFFGIGFIILASSGLYFFINPSYQNSFQARVEYFLGDYERAFKHAQDALKIDKYNKMAFAIFVQSDVALQYQKYIKDGLEYLQKIEVISKKDKISKADKGRIKFMCEISIERFKTLPSSKMTDNELKSSANEINNKFSKIFKELF